MAGFSTMQREATVETGRHHYRDLRLQVAGDPEVVTVEAATAQMEYEHTLLRASSRRRRLRTCR